MSSVSFICMTAQAIFNKAARHLIQQNCKAFHKNATSCAYRSPTGLKCAVGALISQKNYKMQMEGESVSTLILNDLLPGHLVPYKQLLEMLQEVHDDYNPWDWKRQLRHVANEFNLQIPKELND